LQLSSSPRSGEDEEPGAIVQRQQVLEGKKTIGIGPLKVVDEQDGGLQQ
jgi:hypothetical protein